MLNIMLIRVITTNSCCTWEALPWAEKIYGMTKKTFVSKLCQPGHGANLAFKYIHQIKLYIRSNEPEVDEIFNLKLLNKIDPDYMIIDFFFLKLFLFDSLVNS